MSNTRREKRKLLRKYGVLDSVKKTSFSERIEEGKSIHRENLQRMKNEAIKKEVKKGTNTETNPEFPVYRGIDTEYSTFGSFLNAKNWETLESDGDDAVEA